MKIWTFNVFETFEDIASISHHFPGTTPIRSGTRAPLESLSLLFLKGDLSDLKSVTTRSPYHVKYSYSKERKYLQGVEMKHLYFNLPFRVKTLQGVPQMDK